MSPGQFIALIAPYATRVSYRSASLRIGCIEAVGLSGGARRDPSEGEQFKVLGGLALMTAVLTLPLKVDRSALAPRERHTFAERGATWRTQIVRWAAPFLDKEAA
jgi:hypothetical protein